MSQPSLRLPRGTPLENVIAAFNGLAERLDAVEDANPSEKPATADEPLTQADVRQAVEHAVRETRTGLPDATAPWTLHLGPGCTVVNDESGNRFTVEPGNAVKLDADVKLAVLDKAEALIDPDAKPKVVSRCTPGFARSREVREAVMNLQRVLGIPMSGIVGHDTLTGVKFLALLSKH